ncbi:HNH endonuclease [Jatrophihabitans telluris]|uniref:HNH endonuclease n=1 Tax=Jatrophihabitans telluris TaxID=2038343 RepID=A0ABY4QZQ5_9ACTN|nr:HNH endonuclease [Jatrophihabitans telluris]UQX88410.1 HNH endonuclease [Jatrophihabitans telluris]
MSKPSRSQLVELAINRVKSGQWLIDATKGLVISQARQRPIGVRRGQVEVRVPDPSTGLAHWVEVPYLIWRVAVGPLEDGTRLIHRNGDVYDNRIENLQVDTFGSPRGAGGTGGTDSRTVDAALTHEQVQAIRHLLQDPEASEDVIAERYGISSTAVGLIRSGRRYPVRTDVSADSPEQVHTH